MNEKALELNADERTALEKVLAMDVNDMRESHIDHIKARASYLTDAEKARFPFLAEPKAKPLKVKAIPIDEVH